MASLQDAHTIYAVPAGYRAFSTIRPFSILSRLVNGTQQYFSAPSLMSPDLYKALCNCDIDLNDFYGLKINYINDEPVDQYLQAMGKEYGLYLDSGAQVNNLLSSYSPFALQTTAFTTFPADTVSIAIEGNLVAYEFKNFMTTSKSFTSVSDLIALNKPTTSKRNAAGSLDDAFTVDEMAVLDLLEKQAARKPKISVDQAQSLKAHADSLRTSLANSKTTGFERRAYKAVAPIVRYKNVINAWSAYLAAEINPPKIDLSLYPPNDMTIRHEIHASTSSGRRSAKDFSVNTTNIANVTTGNPNLLVSYTESSALSYWSYDETTVIRLKSFYPSDVAAFQKLMNTISHSRSSNGLNKNLILDVSGNTGGYVCASYFALSVMSRAWNKASLTGDDILFSPYDFRQSDVANELYKRGYFGIGAFEVSQVTRKPWGPAFYTDPVPITYDSYTSNYTQRYLWNLCESDNYALAPKANVFDKILIISDGRCGSACSYFISKLRIANKARVLNYGGIWGKQMDSSAFAGGNVYEWAEFVSGLRKEFGTFPWAVQLPTSALTAFNFREMYNPGESYPRQFTPMFPDFSLAYWDPLLGSTSLTSKAEKEILANLYASAVPLFDDIPSGLLGTNTNKSLIVALAIVGIVILTALTTALIIAIISNIRRGTVTSEYSEISGPEI